MKTLFNIRLYGTKMLSKYCFAGFFLFSFIGFSQETPKDSLKNIDLKEVTVSSVRANEKNPITFTNVSKEEIAPRNLGQDIPVLLQYLPSVVSTTDAGNGIGYTYMRVRGSDGSRINVTINGIPYNDSESHGTFFVNLPDFASSLESVQLQRGVGTSTNGAGSFGASLNMQTKSFQEKCYAEIANSFGSFDTRKHTLSFGTRLHNNLELNGRISNIASDGFIDRASSSMFGYFFNANYVTETTLIKLLAFGGKEKTYQAWNGRDNAPLSILSATNPNYIFGNTFNISGIKTNENGNIEGFHNNEIDNYRQNHFQLHWTEKWTEKWISNIALHYTKGKGYFEQYVDDYYYSNVLFSGDSQLSFLGLPDITIDGNTISSMDYIRKRWLDNVFFGSTFSLNYRNNKTDLLIGGAVNRYLGLHYGEVTWNQYNFSNIGRYYDNYGNKDDVNFYAKITHNIDSKLSLFTDMQYRMVFYDATSFRFEDVNDTFRFFNPKAGLNYQLDSKNLFYGYFGVANKEPRRDDYENDATKPERLFDYELGWKYNSKKVRFTANAFYMRYVDQLVLTGALNDVGAPIFTNSGNSYRLGLEMESVFSLSEKFLISPNFTISQNKNQDFIFQRDGILQNLGSTNIAFSPNFIAANRLTYIPVKNLQLSFLSKYVGEQFMGNIDAESSKLEAYFVNDLNISYEIKMTKIFKAIQFNALINNIFDLEYESNGYFYTFDDDFSSPGTITTIEGAGFYPQAGINFLAGVTLLF
ncbi:TonB-dependent receptor [Flavobacterium sp.]|jgi:iron complex outermembrane receptor protein|uniref:TonB-dependent receptor n=1 Tax=Flavobacterium sp. TaxID=239 RepID=UPI0037C0D114